MKFQLSSVPVALRKLFMKQPQCSAVHCVIWLISVQAASQVNKGVGHWVEVRYRWVRDYTTILWKGNCWTCTLSSVTGSWTSYLLISANTTLTTGTFRLIHYSALKHTSWAKMEQNIQILNRTTPYSHHTHTIQRIRRSILNSCIMV